MDMFTLIPETNRQAALRITDLALDADCRSHLFMVHIWVEALGDGRAEWRGQVQHPLSGETRYFGEWSAVVE